MSEPRIVVDGRPVADAEAVIPAFDWGVIRGFGCFEVVRVYGSRPFRLGEHIDRFYNSARLLGLKPAVRERLADWVATVADGDCLVRFYMTGGSRDPRHRTDPVTVVIREEIPAVPDVLTVLPLDAPWHPAGRPTELGGAKTLSYAPNMAASIAARTRGFDDALLVTGEGAVLEGPTFSIGWFRDGSLCTPSLDLGILASITRAAALEAATTLGMTIRDGTFTLDDVNAADEVFALSTVKEVRPVGRVGDVRFEAGPLTAKLIDTFQAIVAAETGA